MGDLNPEIHKKSLEIMRLEDAVQLAMSQAAKASGNFRHGAVIIAGKQVLALGRNHDRKSTGMYSIHAEMDALWHLAKEHKKNQTLKIVVVRVTKSGKLAHSRPCHLCMQALRQYNVKTMVYSTIDPAALQIEPV